MYSGEYGVVITKSSLNEYRNINFENLSTSSQMVQHFNTWLQNTIELLY